MPRTVIAAIGTLPRVDTTDHIELRAAGEADTRYRCREGGRVELHSEVESFRKAHVLRAPDGSAATLLVLRRRACVWLTFSGAEKTSVTMTGPETDELIDTLTTARSGTR